MFAIVAKETISFGCHVCSKPGSIRLDAEGRSKGRWGRKPAEHSPALSTRLEEEEGLEGPGQALGGFIQLHVPTSIPKAVGPLRGGAKMLLTLRVLLRGTASCELLQKSPEAAA